MATSGGVQSGGSVSGALIVAANSDEAAADDPTSIPFDGSQHIVSFVTASPPEWMDDAGNIILPGLYQIRVDVDPDVAPTVPALFGVVATPAGGQTITADGVTAFGSWYVFFDIAVASADLPFAVVAFVEFQTDITGVASAQGNVERLASATT